MARIHWTN